MSRVVAAASVVRVAVRAARARGLGDAGDSLRLHIRAGSAELMVLTQAELAASPAPAAGNQAQSDAGVVPDVPTFGLGPQQGLVEWQAGRSAVLRVGPGDSLQSAEFCAEIWRTGPEGQDERVALAKIGLRDFASGPSCLILPLLGDDGSDPSAPLGELILAAGVEVIPDVVTLRISDLSLESSTLALEPGSTVSFFVSLAAHIKATTRPQPNACSPGESLEWKEVDKIAVSGCSVSQIAFEYVVANLMSAAGEVVADAYISISQFTLLDGSQMSFEADLVPHSAESGEARPPLGVIRGLLAFPGLEPIAQMQGGVYVNGAISTSSPDFPDQEPPRRLFDNSVLPSYVPADVSIPVFDRNIKNGEQSDQDDPEAQDLAPELPSPARLGLSATFTSKLLATARISKLLAPSGKQPKNADEIDSDQARDMIEKLQAEHEAKLAGLRQSHEKKRNDQRARLERRREQRKKALEREKQLRESLEATAIAASIVRSETREPVVSERSLEEVFVAAERQLYQKLDAAAPARPHINAAIVSIPLPPDWELRYTTSGAKYYCYVQGGTCFATWDDPRLVPMNWEMRIGMHGKLFFVHHLAGQATFCDPRGAPIGWDVTAEPGTGRLLFIWNKLFTYVDPRGLPPNFEARLEDGTAKINFRNTITGEVTDEDPRSVEGVTPELRDMWLQIERAQWHDMMQDELRKCEVNTLELYAETFKKEVEAWADTQRDIAMAAANEFSTHIRNANLAGLDEESAKPVKDAYTERFDGVLARLETGWAEEAQKIDLERTVTMVELLKG